MAETGRERGRVSFSLSHSLSSFSCRSLSHSRSFSYSLIGLKTTATTPPSRHRQHRDSYYYRYTILWSQFGRPAWRSGCCWCVGAVTIPVLFHSVHALLGLYLSACEIFQCLASACFSSRFVIAAGWLARCLLVVE